MIAAPFLADVPMWPPVEFLGVIVLLALAFVAVAVRHRRAPSHMRAAAVIVVAFALATATGLYTAWAYEEYVQSYGWQFNYHVSIQGNTSNPESLIVPVPQDETLLERLHLQNGRANWSIVNTPHGRGLYVQFEGSAELDTYESMMPPPVPQSAADATMTAPSNCTVGIANCTGAPQLWMYYSGSTGVHVMFMIGLLAIQSYPAAGWATYETQVFAM